MTFSAEAHLRSRKMPLALIQTLPVDNFSKTCDDHDEFNCGHWVHEIYVPPEDFEKMGLTSDQRWTIWSPGFMEFIGTKKMEAEENEA